jgi:hypothetical protein
MLRAFAFFDPLEMGLALIDGSWLIDGSRLIDGISEIDGW